MLNVSFVWTPKVGNFKAVSAPISKILDQKRERFFPVIGGADGPLRAITAFDAWFFHGAPAALRFGFRAISRPAFSIVPFQRSFPSS